MPSSHKMLKTKDAIIVLMSFIIPALLILALVFSTNTVNLPFDSVKWKAEVGDGVYMGNRHRMAHNLIDSGILLRKSKNEVIELLGADGNFDPISNHLIYLTDVNGSFLNPDPIFEELVVIFDENGFVKDVVVE